VITRSHYGNTKFADNQHLKTVYIVDINCDKSFKDKYREVFRRENLLNFDFCGKNAIIKFLEYIDLKQKDLNE